MATFGDSELPQVQYFTDCQRGFTDSIQFTENVGMPHNTVPPNFQQAPVFNTPQTLTNMQIQDGGWEPS